jgi:hypothetical protein
VRGEEKPDNHYYGSLNIFPKSDDFSLKVGVSCSDYGNGCDAKYTAKLRIDF